MQTYTGRCLCGQSHFTVDLESLDVYACHCTICQKWSGGIAMYLEACGQPMMDADAFCIVATRGTVFLFRLWMSVVDQVDRH